MIIYVNISSRLKALDEIYKIYALLHFLNPIETHRKTMKNISGRRPPVEAHGPEEAPLRIQEFG